MSESIFSKYFRAMQDRTARHEIEEEQKLERNFKRNIFSGKTTFIGIVMSDPGGIPNTAEGQVTQNNFRAVKVFIEGLDDSFVDPKAIIDSMADDEKQAEAFNNVVGGLLTAYPDSELKGGEPNPNFQMGCRVELRFFDQGPQSDHHGKMRGLRYTKVLNSSDSRYSALAGQFEPFGSAAFNTGNDQPLSLTGDYEVVGSRKKSDLDPAAQRIMTEFEDAVRLKDRTIPVVYTSTYRSLGKQIQVEFSNVKRSTMGEAWYRKTYRMTAAREQMLANYLANPNNLEKCIQLNVPLLPSKSSHNKRFGADVSTVTLPWSQALILEQTAQEFVSNGKFTFAKWELQSLRSSPQNRERRKNGGGGVAGEHIHISINPAGSDSGQY
jgi:hypothetical protein